MLKLILFLYSLLKVERKITKAQQRTKLKTKLFVHNFSFRTTFSFLEVDSKRKIIAFVTWTDIPDYMEHHL